MKYFILGYFVSLSQHSSCSLYQLQHLGLHPGEEEFSMMLSRSSYSFRYLSRCQLNIFITGFMVVQLNPILRCSWWCSSSLKIQGRLWGSKLKPLKIWPMIRINLTCRKFFIQQLHFESEYLFKLILHWHKVPLVNYFTTFKILF